MTATLTYQLAGAAIFAIGLVGLVVAASLIRRLIAANIVGAGAFLVLIATAYGDGSAPPDAVPQAMVLTGIVVAVSITALGLSMVVRLHAVESDGHDASSDDARGGGA